MNAAEQLIDQGREEGRAAQRGRGAIDRAERHGARANNCVRADTALLTKWLELALTASSEAAVFAAETR